MVFFFFFYRICLRDWYGCRLVIGVIFAHRFLILWVTGIFIY